MIRQLNIVGPQAWAESSTSIEAGSAECKYYGSLKQ